MGGSPWLIEWEMASYPPHVVPWSSPAPATLDISYRSSWPAPSLDHGTRWIKVIPPSWYFDRASKKFLSSNPNPPYLLVQRQSCSARGLFWLSVGGGGVVEAWWRVGDLGFGGMTACVVARGVRRVDRGCAASTVTARAVPGPGVFRRRASAAWRGVPPVRPGPPSR